jgi:hypothetical protein
MGRGQHGYDSGRTDALALTLVRCDNRDGWGEVG